MKTINEVIKALDYCLNPIDNFGNCCAECPYISCCDPTKYDVTKDALFYLSYLYQILSNDGSKERTAKVRKHEYCNLECAGEKIIRYEYLCGKCKKKVLDGDDYCSHCGSKLDWSENE